MADICADILAVALRKAAKDDELFGPQGICPIAIEECGQAPKVVLVTGENASGKSLFCRLLAVPIRDAGVDVMPLGMGLRTSAGMERAVVYGGDEGSHSTGQLSLRATLSGLRNVTGGEPRVLILDEPDIGLSESFAAAMGQRIASFCADMPEDSGGVVVVTHSHSIAGMLMAIGPWCVRVGADLRPTATWVKDGPLPMGSDDIELLFEAPRKRHSAVTSLMAARREAAKEEKRRLKMEAEAVSGEAEEGYRVAFRTDGAASTALEAASRYLVAGLDAQAVKTGLDVGFAIADGQLTYAGKEIGPISIRTKKVREGVRRAVVSFCQLEDFTLNEEGLYGIYWRVADRCRQSRRRP